MMCCESKSDDSEFSSHKSYRGPNGACKIETSLRSKVVSSTLDNLAN